MTAEALSQVAFDISAPRRVPEVLRTMKIGEIQAQADFFRQTFQEAADQEASATFLKGPVYGRVFDIITAVEAGAKAIHSGITGEHLMAEFYQSSRAKAAYAGLVLSSEQKDAVFDLQTGRHWQFYELGTRLAAKSQGVAIEPGILDEPPYLYQGDGSFGESRDRGCFNACFRMVFSAITGDYAHEGAVADGLRKVHRSVVAEDEEYLKVFSTRAFKAAYPDKATKVLTIHGADLVTLKTLTTKLKGKRPDVSAYCIINIESEVAPDIWHTNILLGTERDDVVVHDPAADKSRGKSFRRIGKVVFHQRWAAAHNRAHVIIAA